MKYKLMGLAALLVMVAAAVVPLSAHAASNMRGGQSVTIGKSDVVDASAYLAGNTVTVEGEVQGDLYCAGQNITITGRVDGDVICAGQTVRISGTVVGNVRVAGQAVTIDGSVGRGLTAFGQSVTQTNHSVVNNDATIFGSALELSGKIGRDATVGGQTVSLTGTVGRNLTSNNEQLTLSSGAVVGGSIDYTSKNSATVNQGAKVGGKTNRHEPPKHEERAKNTYAEQLGMALYWFGATLVFGLVLLAFVPRTYAATSKTMLTQGGWALLAGLAALVATPIVVVVLMMTVIALPLAIVLFFAWLSSLLVAYVYAAYSLGAWIADQAKWQLKWPQVTWLLVGMIVLWLGMLIPVVGGLLGFVALVWGLGGITLACGSHMGMRKEAKPVKKAKA